MQDETQGQKPFMLEEILDFVLIHDTNHGALAEFTSLTAKSCSRKILVEFLINPNLGFLLSKDVINER